MEIFTKLKCIKKIPIALWVFVVALLILFRLYHESVRNVSFYRYYANFLVNAYWVFAIFLILGLIVTAYLLYVKNISIYKAFLVVSSLIGIVYLFLTFNHTPDADVHFYSSYALSNLFLGNPINSIRSVDADALTFFWRTELIDYVELHESLLGSVHPYEIIESQISILHNRTPWLHFPGAVGIAIARLFRASPTMLFFSASLANLITFIVGVYFALKIIPFAKLLLFCIALFPTTMSQAASYNPDNVINILAFLLIALVFHLAHKQSNDEAINIREIIFLCILTPLIAVSRVGTYLPMVGLLLLIFIARNKAVKMPRSHLLMYFIVPAITIAVFIFSTLSSILWALPGDLYLPQDGGVTSRSLSHILSNPVETIIIALHSLVVQGELQLLGAVGIGKGFQFFEIPIRHVSLIFAFILLAILSVQNIRINAKQRIIFSAVTFFTVAISYFAMLMIFTPANVHEIQGVQGRYFTPLLPLVFLLFAGIPWLQIKKDISRGIITTLFSLQILMIINFFLVAIHR